MHQVKSRKRLVRAFGENSLGMIDFPTGKFSNVRISRVIYGDNMGCSYCFPHGFETVNSTLSKQQRNWKKFRCNQWKNK